MAAIHSCPGCPTCRVAPNLAELRKLRDLHEQVVHGSLTRSNDHARERPR